MVGTSLGEEQAERVASTRGTLVPGRVDDVLQAQRGGEDSPGFHKARLGRAFKGAVGVS